MTNPDRDELVKLEAERAELIAKNRQVGAEVQIAPQSPKVASAGIESGPSDTRPADVMVDELASTLRNVIEAADRALGDHIAPHDCFATGPRTGDPFADLVVCPGCVQRNEIAKARALLDTYKIGAK